MNSIISAFPARPSFIINFHEEKFTELRVSIKSHKQQFIIITREQADSDDTSWEEMKMSL